MSAAGSAPCASLPPGAGVAEGAERASRFIIEQVQARAGRCAYQGKWPTPLARGEGLSPSVRVVAEQRLCGVPLGAARALVLWAEGARVLTLEHVPAPATVLRLQSRGARCVSLLPPHVSPAPHADALAFALHDLCHLDKLLDPDHHIGQVGFFATVWSARQTEPWRSFERRFDTVLGDEWDHVISDMNGSAVFLFAAMKMKLKMAARRRLARRLGVTPPEEGRLGPGEQADYRDQESAFFELLGLGGDLAKAAHTTATNRANLAEARQILAHFEAVGRGVLTRIRTGSETTRSFASVQMVEPPLA